MNTYKINGIRMDIPDSMDEMHEIMKSLVEENSNYISFINPEIFIQAEKNAFLKRYLDESKYNFVDGSGLLLAINRMFKSEKYTAKDRYTGTDFFSYLDEDRRWKIFLYGASNVNNEKAKQVITKKYANVEVVGNIDGYSSLTDNAIVNMINACSPDIVIVCLGFPKQEMWIKKHRGEINAKLIFGNGGSIDFWSENVKRAPQYMIEHNAEWMYRLFQDFNIKRIKRQLRLIPFAIKSYTKKWDIKKQ